MSALSSSTSAPPSPHVLDQAIQPETFHQDQSPSVPATIAAQVLISTEQEVSPPSTPLSQKKTARISDEVNEIKSPDELADNLQGLVLQSTIESIPMASSPSFIPSTVAAVTAASGALDVEEEAYAISPNAINAEVQEEEKTDSEEVTRQLFEEDQQETTTDHSTPKPETISSPFTPIPKAEVAADVASQGSGSNIEMKEIHPEPVVEAATVVSTQDESQKFDANKATIVTNAAKTNRGIFRTIFTCGGRCNKDN